MASSPRYESDSTDASPLGQPLKFEFSGRTAPNRFLKGAMTERISSWDPENLEARGVPSKNLVNLYRRWGEGGIGLILSGNIMIEYDHLEAAGNPIIPRESGFSGERFDAFKEMATEAKKHGSLFVGQVSHPGRQVESRIQKNPVSASDVQLEGNIMGMTFEKPHAATDDDIARITEGFAHAAEYLEKAGFDGIELHAAHGYLLAQFLSPTTNQRTDKYGGSLENRARLIVEITDAIRARVSPSFVVGIKLNSVEFQDKGFNPEEAAQLCRILESHAFDFVELSGGTYEKLAFGHQRESTKKREGFFLEFAEAIAPALSKTRTYITGGFKTVGAMVQALSVVDGVGLARPLAQEPRLCADMLAGRVSGAIKQSLDEENFGLTNVAAGTQMRQVGKDQTPLDLSRKENVDAFMKDMGAWGAKMAGDGEMRNYGYVDIESAQAVPYGTASV
ncbi:FMN-linked oxidoreductase [Didymella exigua CBS 183.55]|uniref:FMN-linked oxidoreductase n=1 Tax=Didymella exigua CBS 183.55 TaxID=1150837 RepID=A0A6A5R456_9PLEO|nr:FMN-linked oxidoreductase [Didymella exigua CBS 183.55]KAF1922861.1 FMN-linked oxidoreductase [Didymella exigua CBS 183.55]